MKFLNHEYPTYLKYLTVQMGTDQPGAYLLDIITLIIPITTTEMGKEGCFLYNAFAGSEKTGT